MKIVNTENTEQYKWGDNSDGWHLLNSESLSVIEECVPPGDKEQRHYHSIAQQFFYVLSGIAEIKVDEKSYLVDSGSGIHVPAKVPHQLVNSGDESLRFLVVSEPRSHGDRINL